MSEIAPHDTHDDDPNVVDANLVDAVDADVVDENAVDADGVELNLCVVNAEIAPAEFDSEISLSDVIDAPVVTPADQETSRRSWWSWLIQRLATIITWLVGMVTLVFVLASLASVPVLQFISLGYLLESTGRIARSGKFRDGFVGYRTAARVGTVICGIWLTLLPIRIAAKFSHATYAIDPDGTQTIIWRVAVTVLTIVLSLHAASAVYCGGKLRDFFWPILVPLAILSLPWRKEPLENWFPPMKFFAAIRRGEIYDVACRRLWEFLQQLRVKKFLWLGLRGYALTMVWIGIPGLLMASILTGEGLSPPMLFFSGLLMAIVVMYLPLLQAHFAAEDRWQAMFEWRHVRRLFTRAPLAMLISITVTFVLAVPLYLAKIEATSDELTWIPNVLMILSVIPCHWVAGWAMSRARRRETPRHAISCWFARLWIPPLSMAYVFFIGLAAYISWDGGWSFLQQHAFLIPAAFLGSS
ncbi:MAG: hypothetical protein ABGX22_28410 [Pirellulaceae bacterium]